MIGCLSKYLVTSPYWTISFRYLIFMVYIGKLKMNTSRFSMFLPGDNSSQYLKQKAKIP